MGVCVKSTLELSSVNYRVAGFVAVSPSPPAPAGCRTLPARLCCSGEEISQVSVCLMETDPGAPVMCQAALWGSVAPVLPHLEPDESDSALEDFPQSHRSR